MTAALIIAKDSLLLDQTKPVGTETLKAQVCVEPCTAGCIVNAGCHHSSDIGRHQSISAANQLYVAAAVNRCEADRWTDSIKKLVKQNCQ